MIKFIFYIFLLLPIFVIQNKLALSQEEHDSKETSSPDDFRNWLIKRGYRADVGPVEVVNDDYRESYEFSEDHVTVTFTALRRRALNGNAFGAAICPVFDNLISKFERRRAFSDSIDSANAQRKWEDSPNTKRVSRWADGEIAKYRTAYINTEHREERQVIFETVWIGDGIKRGKELFDIFHKDIAEQFKGRDAALAEQRRQANRQAEIKERDRLEAQKARESAREDRIAHMPIYVLKNGSRIRCEMKVESQDELTVKDENGKFHTIKRNEISEIIDQSKSDSSKKDR